MLINFLACTPNAIAATYDVLVKDRNNGMQIVFNQVIAHNSCAPTISMQPRAAMRASFFLFLGMVLACAGSATHAETRAAIIAQCASALKNDVVQKSSNYTLRYAYLQVLLSNKNSFESAKKDGSLMAVLSDVPVGFDYSETNVRNYAEQIRKTTNVSYSIDEAEGFTSSTLSKTGASAFVDCVKAAIGKDGGVILSFDNTDATLANVHIEWVGIPRVNKAKLVFSVTNGKVSKGTDPNKKIFTREDSSASTIIIRDANKPLGITANVVDANGTQLSSDSVTVPVYSNWVNEPKYELRRSKNSSGITCGWVNGSRRDGPSVEVRIVGDGERILPDTAAFVLEVNSGPLDVVATSYGRGYWDWNEKTGIVASAHAICSPSDASREAAVQGYVTATVEVRNLINKSNVHSFVQNDELKAFDRNRIAHLPTSLGGATGH